MIKEKMMIWGRELELEVKYDCYTGEKILESQKDALKVFLKSEDTVGASLEQVKSYCLAHNKKDITDGVVENIFKYVAPKYLYVLRETSKRVVAVMCNYRFDPENGIAVVFENEELVKIGKQDTVL